MQSQDRSPILQESRDAGAAEGHPGRFPILLYLLSPVFCFAALLPTVIFVGVSVSTINDRKSGSSTDEIVIHASRIDGVAFSPDGRFAASASSDRTIKVWEFATRRQGTIAISRVSGFSSIGFSPDGRTLASGTLDGRVFLSDLQDDQPERSFKANETEGSVRIVRFSPDGGSLATGGDDQAVHLWDVSSGRERLIMRGHDATVSGLAYAPDGKTIFSISADGRVISWDARTGQIRDRVEGGCGPLWSIAVSPDGRWAALGGRDGIALRNLEDGRAQVYRCSQIAFTSLGFLPGGTTLASASLEGTTMLWKVERGTLRPWRTLDQQAKPLKALAVSPDGKTLATGGNDAILRFWEI